MKHISFAVLLLSSTLLTSACITNEKLASTAQTFLGSSLSSGNAHNSALSTEQITLGLKEALRVGAGNVVTQLGKTGGFSLDKAVRIPLPNSLAKVHNALSAVGMGGMTQDLENRMNEAAELAVPQAKDLFIAAIKHMTITDARQILFGNQQDAATQYLRRTMGAELGAKIQPIVASTLAKTGAVQAYDRVTAKYATLPLVSSVKTDMNAYVTDKALDGMFFYVAKEEAAIRENPAKRTTELLRTVFGSVN